MPSSILISVINVFLSPFGIIFFLLFTLGEGKYFESAGTNTSRLKLMPFLVHHVIFTVLVLAVTYLWSTYSAVEFSVWDVFIPKYYWASGIGWLATILIIKTYLKGMEGNVMGFIFFPMLLITSVLLIGVNVGGFLSVESQERLRLVAPQIDLNIWVRLLLHTFLPVYMLLFLNKNTSEGEEEMHWGGLLLSSLIFQMMSFAIHWVIFWLTNHELTFSQYFGENQNLLYYLPAVIGALYFIFSISTKRKKIANEALKYAVFMVLSVMIFLEVANYLLMIKVSWAS